MAMTTQKRGGSAASISWADDLWGNTVATAIFSGFHDTMAIESASRIKLDAVAWPIFDIAASAIIYPFQYAQGEWPDLGALTVQQYPDA